MSWQLETPSRCPDCKALLDGATEAGPGNASPSAGDVTVCLYCGVFLEYRAGLALERMTDAKFESLPADVRRLLMRARVASRLVGATKPRK